MPPASRGIGGVELLGESLPPWAIEFLGDLTVLGDTVTLGFAFLLVYWLSDRATGVAMLSVFAVGVLGMAGLKAGFALPRPPSDMRLLDANGYGFPSGHAFNATVGFGLLAQLRSDISPRWRYGLAALGIAIVSLSRVAIGVHYVVDVLAGITIGLVYVVVAWQIAWPRRHRMVAILDRTLPTRGGDRT